VVNKTVSENGVFDSTGRLLGTYPSRDDRYSYEWSGPSKILAVLWANQTALHSRSLTSGRTTPVKITTENIAEPRWSPDGKHIAYARRNPGPKWEIIVMNPDGSGARTCPVVGRFTGLLWSPDGQRIAYRAHDSASGPYAAGELGTLDATSCAYTRIARGRLGNPQWTRDSKRIHFPELVDSSSSAPTKHRWRLHERPLSGPGRIIAEGSSNAQPAIASITDTTVMLLDTPDGDVLILTNSGKRTMLLPRGSRYSIPSRSLDGHWMAIRSGTQTNFNTLHVMRTNGTEHTSIDLPFTAIAGPGNPVFLPGNRELIALGTHASSDSVAYYRVNAATKAVTRILTAGKAMGRNGPEFTVSPDGSTLLYSTRNPPHSTIVELDLSSFLNRLR
jgi:Tol biopolymer transport system component